MEKEIQINKLKWRKNEGMLNHILNGGLDVRTIKK